MIERFQSDSLLRNSLYIMATTISQSGLGFIFWLVAARGSSAHDVGLAAALISGVTLVSLLSSIGISGSLIQLLPGREPGYERSRLLCAGYAAGICTGLVAAAITVVALPFFSAQFRILHTDGGYISAFVIGVPLWTVATLLDNTFLAERRAGAMLARATSASLLKTAILLAILPLTMLGALGIFGASVLASVGGVGAGIILLIRLDRNYRLVVHGLVGQARSMVASALGNHLIHLGSTIVPLLLPPLVTARLSATDNAYFYTTWMVGGIFLVISPAVASSLFAEGSHDANDLRERTVRSARVITLMMLPLMAVYLLGGQLILGLFGVQYAQHGHWLLIFMVISAIPDAITNLFVSVLQVRRRLAEAARLNLGMAAISLVLTWLLLPSLGIEGVGVAWLIGQSCGSLYVWRRRATAFTPAEQMSP